MSSQRGAAWAPGGHSDIDLLGTGAQLGASPSLPEPRALVPCPVKCTAFCPFCSHLCPVSQALTDVCPPGSEWHVFRSGTQVALWVWGLIWQRPLRSWLATQYNRNSCGFGEGSPEARCPRLFLVKIPWGERGPMWGSCLKGCQGLTQMLPGKVLATLVGRDACFLRLLARQSAGPLGPQGDPDVVSFQLRWFPKWEEGTGEATRRRQGPLGLTEKQARRVHPLLQAAGCGEQRGLGADPAAPPCRAAPQASPLQDWAPRHPGGVRVVSGRDGF